jgi:hypothetical protein
VTSVNHSEFVEGAVKVTIPEDVAGGHVHDVAPALLPGGRAGEALLRSPFEDSLR